MKKILKLLENNATLTPAEIAAMLDMTPEAVAAEIETARAGGVLLGTRSVVDWDRAGGELVTAMIHVKVTPQRGEGFDRVAERIYQFEEVESLYLMSGGYDLQVVITGKTLKEVARFVAERLSTLDQVTETATHFLLKKYKEGGVIYKKPEDQEERVTYL